MDPITISAIIGGIVTLVGGAIDASGRGPKNKAEDLANRRSLAAQIQAQNANLHLATLQSQGHVYQLEADRFALLEKHKQSQFYAVVGVAGLGVVAGLTTFYFIRRSQ